jgi:hypothetical protein
LKKELVLAFHLSPAETESVEYKKMVSDQLNIVMQEDVGEDKSRIAAQGTNLYCQGDASTALSIINSIANICVVANAIVHEPEKSDFIKNITPFAQALTSKEGVRWFAKFKKSFPFIGPRLLQEIQSIQILHVSLARHSQLVLAQRKGDPLPVQFFSSANTSATNIFQALEQQFRMGILKSAFREAPSFYTLMNPKATSSTTTAPTRTPAQAKNPRDRLSPTTLPNAKRHQPHASHPNPRSDQRSNSSSSTATPTNSGFTDDQIETMKQQGFLRAAPGKQGGICYTRFVDPRSTRGQTQQVCMNWIVRGRACKFRNCSRLHPKSISDFANDSDRAKFSSWLGEQTDLSLIDG